MKKVKSTLILKRKTKFPSKNIEDWGLHLVETGRVKEEILQQWLRNEDAEEIELEITIKSIFQFKSNEQLGYLHAEIWRKWYNFYKDQGYATENKDIQEKIRNDIKLHEDVAFYSNEINDLTNNEYKKVKSFSKSSKEETSVIIERIIRLGNEFGITFIDSEEYKKQKRLKLKK